MAWDFQEWEAYSRKHYLEQQEEIKKVKCKKKDLGLCNKGWSIKDPNKYIGCEKLRQQKKKEGSK